MDNERREFIKNSCTLCAGVLGLSALLPALQSCVAITTLQLEPTNNTFQLPITSFIENSKVVVIKHKSLSYPLAVVQVNINSYRCFELKCTHQDNGLGVSNSGFFCSMHGSNYDLNGKVLSPPASRNLKEFNSSLQGEKILVTV